MVVASVSNDNPSRQLHSMDTTRLGSSSDPRGHSTRMTLYKKVVAAWRTSQRESREPYLPWQPQPQSPAELRWMWNKFCTHCSMCTKPCRSVTPESGGLVLTKLRLHPLQALAVRRCMAGRNVGPRIHTGICGPSRDRRWRIGKRNGRGNECIKKRGAKRLPCPWRAVIKFVP